MPENPLDPPGFPAEIPESPKLSKLGEVMVRCTRCDLFRSRTQVVPGAGSESASILFVGEAPGAREDRQGVPFVGASGRLLDRVLESAGISRDDVFIANVVRCRPPQNRNPKMIEIRACAGWLGEQVRLIDPDSVVTLGRFALQHFIPGAKITQVQGAFQKVSYGDRTITLYPLLHPAAILRNPKLRDEYERQFQALASG